MKLQMILFHNKNFEDVIEIEVDSDCTVLQFKEKCMSKQDKLTELYNIGLLHKDDGNVLCFLQNNNSKLNDFGPIKPNSIIYVFRVNDVLLISAYLYDQTPITNTIKKNKSISSQYYMKIAYNKLQTTSTIPLEYDQIIVVPNSLTIGDLRGIVSRKLCIHIDECVLRKKWHDIEFKNNTKLLKDSGIHSGTIYVEKGTPLKPDEYMFQIFVDMEYNKKGLLVFGYVSRITSQFRHNDIINMVPTSIKNLCFAFYYEKELNEQLDWIGDMVLNKHISIQDMKHRIHDKYHFYVPHPSFMRIRDFVKEWNKYKMCDQYVLRDVYYDNLTLHGVLKSRIKDFQQIAIQRIEYVEKDQLDKKKHLLLNICRYYPAQQQLGNIMEMQFDKDCKITTDLRQKLGEFVGVPFENILVKCFAKPNRLNDIQNLHNLFRARDSMNYGINDASTLSSEPWKCKNGYFIVFVAKCDSKTPLKRRKAKRKTKAKSKVIHDVVPRPLNNKDTDAKTKEKQGRNCLIM